MPLSRIGANSIESGVVAISDLAATGTPSETTFLRGDNTWSTAGGITSGTAQAATSGTVKDFTGIPSTAKRITVMLRGVSTGGTSNIMVQLGTGATPTYTTTGYLGTIANISSASGSLAYTTGLGFTGGNSNATIWHGTMQINSFGSNTWVSSVGAAQSNQPIATTGGGSVTLAGTLTAVRVTTVGGAESFDAGSINIMWE